jgi:hypothetical protein
MEKRDFRIRRSGRYTVYFFSHFFIAKKKDKPYQIYTRYHGNESPKVDYDKGIIIAYPQDFFGEYDDLWEAMMVVRRLERTIKTGKIRPIEAGGKGTAAMFQYPETGARIYKYPERYPEEAVHEWAHGYLHRKRVKYEDSKEGELEEERDAVHLTVRVLRDEGRWTARTRRDAIEGLSSYIGRKEAEKLVFEWEREPLDDVPKLTKWIGKVLEESKDIKETVGTRG